MHTNEIACLILDFKLKNATGFQSSRETDLGVERGEVDCRASSDIEE